MRNFKTAMLSTAAMIAVVATTGTVAAQGFGFGFGFGGHFNQILFLVDELIHDFRFPEPPKPPAPPKKPPAPVTVTSQVDKLSTKTAIKHLVVIFNENESFDHYFGTYPKALNPGDGEPNFTAARGTPSANNYETNKELLLQNPNLNLTNGTGAANPFRIDRTQANTADQSHSYTPEQKAFDNGALDLFPLNTGSDSVGGPTGLGLPAGLGSSSFGTTGQVMGYFDGNTVTAFWNYAQNYAMSDNAWSDQFGPSTPGAINMFSGQTNGIIGQTTKSGVVQTPFVAVAGNVIADGTGAANGFTLIGDEDPTLDVCSPAVQPGGSGTTVTMTGKNIGDLLNAANIPWGSFVGGFNLSLVNSPSGTTGCTGATVSNGQVVFGTNTGRQSLSPVTGEEENDYVQHHIWFQYYQSTANPNHLRPSSAAAVGLTNIPGTTTADPANHAYDLEDFTTAVQGGNFPAVSLIKMPKYQDAHPGNSNPLDEQTGVVNLINMLQDSPEWDSTAVIIAYDDSDGWYDHVYAPANGAVLHGSFDATADQLNGPGKCGVLGSTPVPNGVNGVAVNGRCGPGMRQPFLLISPWAKKNYIDHTVITQASIPQFIEDNWLDGKRIGGGSFDASTGSIMNLFNFKQTTGTKLVLDPTEGTVLSSSTVKLD